MQHGGGNPGGANQQSSEKPGGAGSGSAGFEPMDLEPKKPSSLVTIATVIIVVAIIIIISNAIREEQTGEEAETIHEGDLTVEVGDSHVETGDAEANQDSEESPVSVLSADFLSPDEFTDLDRAENIINSTQGKNPGTKAAEFIQAGIVPDPEEAGIYYFATSTPNAESNFVGVYKYNLDNANWHRLTKDTFTPDDRDQTAMLRVLGKEGGNLILMKDRMNRAIGSCESLWLQGLEKGFGLFTLKIDEPLHGLLPYELPAALRNSEQEKVNACLEAK